MARQELPIHDLGITFPGQDERWRLCGKSTADHFQVFPTIHWYWQEIKDNEATLSVYSIWDFALV